jgi:hypothetical protein
MKYPLSSQKRLFKHAGIFMSFLLLIPTANASAATTMELDEIFSTLELYTDCPSRISGNSVMCTFETSSYWEGSAKIKLLIQVSTSKGVWKTISSHEVPVNGSKKISVPNKLGMSGGIGTQSIRAYFSYNGESVSSETFTYTADWVTSKGKGNTKTTSTPKPSVAKFTPQWVKNCIMIYSFITRQYDQQCDQAYATGPGHWIKNCTQVYNWTYREYESKCAQTYILD